MQLLPSNSSLREQKFASFLDEMAKEDYDVLSICPLECKVSLLPHLALWLGVDIDGLEESEAREYLKSALTNRTKKGTVGVVEDSIKPFFKSVELFEWWQDRRFIKAEFGFEVEVKEGSKLGKEKFKTIFQKVNEAKNVRSHLAGVKIEQKGESKTKFMGSSAYEVCMNKDLKIDWEFENNLFSNSVITINAKIEKDLETDFLLSSKNNMMGVVIWQV